MEKVPGKERLPGLGDLFGFILGGDCDCAQADHIRADETMQYGKALIERAIIEKNGKNAAKLAQVGKDIMGMGKRWAIYHDIRGIVFSPTLKKLAPAVLSKFVLAFLGAMPPMGKGVDNRPPSVQVPK